jgi:uncharacterized membrane protein YesL
MKDKLNAYIKSSMLLLVAMVLNLIAMLIIVIYTTYTIPELILLIILGINVFVIDYAVHTMRIKIADPLINEMNEYDDDNT